MFDNLFGNVEEQQKAIQEKLTAIPIQATAGDGQIQIDGNATGVITNIAINVTGLENDVKEELEDLMLTAVQRFIEMSKKTESEESAKSIKEMLPPGMENLFG